MRFAAVIVGVACILLLCPIALAGLEDGKFKELTAQARKSLKKDQYAAVSAIKKLAEDNSERAAKFVFGLAASTKTPAMVFRQCIDTLRSMDSQSATNYVAEKAVGSKTADKIVAADVLGKMPGKVALTALAELTRDKDDAIVRLAAAALGEKGDTEAVEPLIEALERTQKEHGLAWQATLVSLRKLTGTDESGPWTPDDWRDFWAAKKRDEQWDGSKKNPELGGPHTELPDFFGAKVVSRNVIFVMDLSGSMLESDSGGQRLARMKEELCRTLGKLDKDTMFNVLGFNSNLFP